MHWSLQLLHNLEAKFLHEAAFASSPSDEGDDAAARRMAAAGIASSRVLLLVVLLWISSSAVLASDAPLPKRPSAFSFYMHDTLQNKTHPWTNTAVEVAGPNHNLTGLGFGKIIVFNDTLTVGPASTSGRMGRGQGVYIYDHTQAGIAFNALLMFSALVETEELKGTINFMGADVILAPSRDISVVGGTGDFELARGIGTITTHSIDGDSFIVLFKVKLFYH